MKPVASLEEPLCARGAPYEVGAPLPSPAQHLTPTPGGGLFSPPFPFPFPKSGHHPTPRFPRAPLPTRAPLFAHTPLFTRTLLAAPVVAIAILAASLLSACGDDAKPAPDAGAPTNSASTAAPAKSTAAPAKPQAPPADGVELLKFQLTTGVKDKDPVDKLDSTKPGQRVYGHVTVRNRTAGPQRVSLSFRVNDDERAMVDLKVEKSWSWRTWAYVTLRKDDKGELTVHAFDDHGAELGTASIPIK